TVLISVVLPAPFGPIMVTMSPRLTVRLTRSTTGRSSNATVTCSSRTRGSVIRLLPLTAGAEASHFQGNVVRKEGFRARRGFDGLIEFRHGQFQDRAALSADQKSTAMMFTGMGTADEGVERGNPVNQAMLKQKVQGPVDRRRRGVVSIRGQLGQDIVGAQRLVGLPDKLQYPFPDRRQTGVFIAANRAGIGQCLGDTGLMVMGAVGQCAFRHGVGP